MSYQATPNVKKLDQTAMYTASQTNYQQLISILSNRIKILYQEQRQIQQKYEKKKDQIQCARPCDIKLNSHHQILKKIVQSAISNQYNSEINVVTNRDNSHFQKQNLQMEAQIQIKMKSIQQLDIDIRSLLNKQQIAFFQLQKSEESLKNILKSKGSIEEAQKKQKEKKAKISEIRYIRQNLTSLKDQKITRIRQVIECLKVLQHYRDDRVHKIQKMFEYNQGCNIPIALEIINNFVGQLENLKNEKMILNKNNNNINATARQMEAFSTFGSRKSSEQNFSGDKSQNRKKNIRINEINSTPRANFLEQTKNFNTTSKKYNSKNQNHLGPKNLQNLFQSMVLSNQQNYSFENIINQYQQILKKFTILSQAQQIYFQNKTQRLNQQINIKALQKSYLIGILGYDPNNNQDDLQRYQNIISFAIKKCVDFSVDLDNKNKDKIKLQQKIKNVEESIKILKSQMQTITSQSENKKNLAVQIEHLFHQNFQLNRKSQTKDIYNQIQHCKIRKNILEKEQQQAAEEGDLDAYKKTQNLIEELNLTMKKLQKKFKYQEMSQNSNKNGNFLENQTYLNKIRQAVMKYSVEVDLGKIINRGITPDSLNKIIRRLLPI